MDDYPIVIFMDNHRIIGDDYPLVISMDNHYYNRMILQQATGLSHDSNPLPRIGPGEIFVPCN